MKIAVLSPHLDDAVLSCWHVLEGREAVTVVNVFTGSPPPGAAVPPWDRLTGADDSLVRMRERRAEDQRALETVGCDSINLGLLDGQYDGARAAPARLADRLRAVLEPHTAVHAPAGLGGHGDHALVRDAAIELARSGWPLTLYADVPHGIGDGWPGWVAGAPEPAGHDVGAAWTRVLAGAGLRVERLICRVRPLDAQTRTRKLRCLDEYRTQRAALDGLAFAPLDDPRVLAFEVSWAVPRSALGGPREPGREPVVSDAGHEPRSQRG